MDEPLSNLDAKLRVYMRAELKHLQEELKATVVYVTQPSKQLILGVRHTAIPLLPATTSEGIPAQIYTFEPTGDVTFVHLQVGEQLITASTDDPEFQGHTGDRLIIKFDENRLHLFDAETTLALTSD